MTDLIVLVKLEKLEKKINEIYTLVKGTPNHAELCYHIDQQSKFYHTDSSGNKNNSPCSEDEVDDCTSCVIHFSFRCEPYQGHINKDQNEDEKDPGFDEDECNCPECRTRRRETFLYSVGVRSGHD